MTCAEIGTQGTFSATKYSAILGSDPYSRSGNLIEHDDPVTEEVVLAALSQVIDPDLKRDIVALGMVKDLQVKSNRVSFTYELTTPACPIKDEMEAMARDAVGAIPGIGDIEIKMSAQVRSTDTAGPLLPNVRNVVAIGSGKGGVGKSTVAANLAIALAQSGATVGLLDADIYGPSIPGLMGTRALPKVIEQDGKKLFQPLIAHGVKLMSIGFLLEADAPVIWRGPMVHSAVRQLLGDTHWSDLDYLIVDLPPGTGDAQLTLIQALKLSGAVIVTQPQDVALDIAIKALKMFRHLKVRILGMLENMSYFICDNCDARHDIFSHGGAQRAAQELEVPFLGEIPLAPDIRESSDAGQPVTALNPESPQANSFRNVAESLAAQVSIAAARQRRTISLRAV